MRSPASAADRELVDRVSDGFGVEVTVTQLERWRSRGLLPRATVRRVGFGGSSIDPHPETVAAAAALLGRSSRRGRPWQLDAELLFNEHHRISDEALGATGLYLINAELTTMRRAWTRAQVDAEPADDPAEEAAEIGERAAALLPRDLRRAVKKEIELAHKHQGATPEMIEEFADRALTWRMVDLVEPGRLSGSHRDLARHGVERSMMPVGGTGAYPLPSERRSVAGTLTWREAEVYRRYAYLRALENPSLGSKRFGPLQLTIWIVTFERLKAHASRLEEPLTDSLIERAWLLLAGSNGKRGVIAKQSLQ